MTEKVPRGLEAIIMKTEATVVVISKVILIFKDVNEYMETRGNLVKQHYKAIEAIRSTVDPKQEHLIQVH